MLKQAEWRAGGMRVLFIGFCSVSSTASVGTGCFGEAGGIGSLAMTSVVAAVLSVSVFTSSMTFSGSFS